MVKEDRSDIEQASLQALMALNQLPGIRVAIVQDEAGRAIYRGRVQVDPKQAGITAKELVEGLQQGEIAIYTRDYGVKQGYFDIDPRPLLGDDLQVIVDSIHKLIGGQ